MIVSESFGRPFRQGSTDVAIGVYGIMPILDLRVKRDRTGHLVQVDPPGQEIRVAIDRREVHGSLRPQVAGDAQAAAHAPGPRLSLGAPRLCMDAPHPKALGS